MGWKMVRDGNEAWCRDHGVSGQWRTSPGPAASLRRKIFEEAGDEPDLTAELADAERIVTGDDSGRGTPWPLGVRCDWPDGCDTSFEGDFLVREDSTRDERLVVVLRWAEQRLGWRVAWCQPAGNSLAFCPAHADDAKVEPGKR